MCGSLFSAQSLILATVIGGISYSLNAGGVFSSSSPIVQTDKGPVRGLIAASRNGRGYAAYLGIPFAEPPVNELRFEAPVPLRRNWEGIFDATRMSSVCIQFEALIRGKFEGSEDCLYLNVYTPRKPNENHLLPVLVWIHGGGFFSGGSSLYNPKYFMDDDVIVVTFNYRLGPLGFLNTDDGFIRGNMGMKDQSLALKWVQDNIAHFGGDPAKVTIFGESAGAASVHYHLVSPASRGLYSSAILQSGSIFCPWSFTDNPRKQALKYAKHVGCPTEDSSTMTKCLKSLSAQKLFEPNIDIMRHAPFADIDLMMTPSIETTQTADTFLAENPRKMILDGNFVPVPVIMGVTSGEGALRTARLEAHLGITPLDKIEKQWDVYSPIVNYYSPERTDVSEKIRYQYFSPEPFTANETGFFKNFTKMVSDGWFYQGLHTAATEHGKRAPVYLYYYDYQQSIPGVYSLLKAVGHDDWLFAELKVAYSIVKDYFSWWFGNHNPSDYGSCHADDLMQQWRLDWIMEITTRSKDFPFSKAFVKSFTDFATNSSVLSFNDVNWPMVEFDDEPYKYMRLDKSGSVINEPFSERLPFWDTLGIREWESMGH